LQSVHDALPDDALRVDDRGQLERIARALGLGDGRCRLLLEFQEGRLAWFEPSKVRQPASKLDELAQAAASA
jgi:hypothetical protein